MQVVRHALLLVVGVSLTAFSLASAQGPDTLWYRTYNNSGGDAGVALLTMSDGGFMIGGYTQPAGEIHRDFYVIRTDADGNQLWDKTYGSSTEPEDIIDIVRTRDGGIILAGKKTPTGGYTDIFLVKIDDTGFAEWGSQVGITGSSISPACVAATSDNGLIVGGGHWNSTTGYDFSIFKINELGLQQWREDFRWPDADYVLSICATRDGGYAVAGRTQSGDSDYDYDMFLMKLTELGAISWIRYYGTSNLDEQARHVTQLSDGGYLVSGATEDFGVTPKDFVVIRTNGSGGVTWSTVVGDVYHDMAMVGLESYEHDFVAAGTWHDDVWYASLVKYNTDGDTLWTARAGSDTTSETAWDLVQTTDGGFVVTGISSGLPQPIGNNIFLAKFDRDPSIDVFGYRVTAVGESITDAQLTEDTIMISIGTGLPPEPLRGVLVTVDTLFHGAVEELTISLIHDGVTVLLVDRPVGGGENFLSTLFCDMAPLAAADGVAPFCGAFRPEEPLSGFAGLDPEGDWTLRINDQVAGTDGTLQSWGLTLLFDIASDITDYSLEIPESCQLDQNYPNPFNPTTTIMYTLPVQAEVTLEVFNLLGQRVKTLIEAALPAGKYVTVWDARTADGQPVASGVYFYRLRAGETVLTRKMVLVR